MAHYQTITSDKNKDTATILCCLGFLGIGGIHDFYLGNYKKGIIKFFTMNFIFFGTVIDLISIFTGAYRDNVGVPLRANKKQNNSMIIV